ncbi:MAG TPA: LuxR C-terminal-related transcriptional regulator, partial [Solirubrobacteraceae bacterium]
RQLLADLVADQPEAVRASRLRDGAEFALPALGLPPAVAPSPDDPLGEGLHALERLCANLGGERPLVLAVDDAHWADRPSLRFLAHIAGRVAQRPLLVLLGFRDQEPGADAELLAQLGELATVLRPRALSPRGVERLVGRAFPAAERGFVDACARLSGANPFYLGEILRAAERDGLPPTTTGSARLEGLSTGELQRRVLNTIRASGDDARRFAEAAALHPAGAEIRHVAAITDLDPGGASRAADALRAAAVLDGHELEFRHPIIRTAVYEAIPGARRAELHRRAANALIAEHGAPHSIVFHLLRAEPANDPVSAAILSDAARTALAAGAFGEARVYSERALAEPPRADQRAQTLRDIGVAEGHLGLPSALDRLQAAADLATTPRLRAEILRELGLALLVAGRFVAVEQVLEQAREALGAEDRDLALEIDADVVAAAQMAMLPTEVIGERLGRHPPAALHGHTYGERCLLAVSAFEAVRRNEPAADALDLAQRALPAAGAPVDISASMPMLLGILALLYAEAYGDVLRILDDGIQRPASARHGALENIWRGVTLLRLGRLGAAADLFGDLLRDESVHTQTVRPLATAIFAEAHVRAGSIADAEGAFEGMMEAPPEEVMFELPLFARGLIHLARRRPAQALADFEACGAKLAARGSVGVAVMEWRSSAALACAALGQEADARRFAGEELELARAFGAPRALGVALRTAGQVGEPSEQLALLEESVAVLEGSPAKLERAASLVALGAALRRHGRRRDARVPLAEGRELARQVGAAPLVERAAEELAAAGARPRRDALTGVEALTEGERRVVRAAASGRTNREIAQELVVTTKTVEAHLRNAYGKLGIRSRKEISGELREALERL